MAPSPRVKNALERARQDALRPYAGEARAAPARERLLAVGDPQAPLETLLAILEGHDALGEAGRLREDLHLVSMGDHFDWGDRGDRKAAARSGLETLAWLAAHPADQVTLILGNHDLARVGELVGFDDLRFSEAQAAADKVYNGRGRVDGDGDVAFRARY